MLTHDNYVLALIGVPLVGGALACAVPWRSVRTVVVCLTAALTALVGVLAVVAGPFSITCGAWSDPTALALELLLIGVIVAYAWEARAWLIVLLALVQLGLCLTEQFSAGAHAPATPTFVLDTLSSILVIIVCVIGALIVVYATGYMREHAAHAPRTTAGDRRFFLVLVGFLGVMNGLVLANNLRWLAVFWESTTLCSFLLIGHEGTAEARANALRALLINAFGGVALSLAALLAAHRGGITSLDGIMGAQALAPMALLCIAAMTKSAQFPFQSWLLGAMVAPTPVSALLHSATMVKAGSYLILRLAPAFAGTRLLDVVALAGGFTFAIAAALAVSQSNAKRVLAYSTISNLGLIVACAGIATPLAYAAAIMILCYHAASKGLLFLCVGAIEQKIGSRDIEDMGSLLYTMPLTTVITLTGMLTMLMPPFGMLMSKLMAIEAAIEAPFVLLLVIAGSALTVFFWAKWIGRMQTVSYHPHYPRETMPFSMASVLVVLCALVAGGGVASILVYRTLIEPMALHTFATASAHTIAALHAAGNLLSWPVFVFPLLAALAWLWTIARFNPAHVRLPYLAGENYEEKELSYAFLSIKDQPAVAWTTSLYFKHTLNELRITPWANLIAWLLVLSLLGVLGMR